MQLVVTKDVLAIKLHFRWMYFESIEPDILLLLALGDCIFELASESSLRETPFSLVKSSIDSMIR